jgi:DNA repair exonuclease SbcCD ATPase subunit/DNA repair exonuclease SbcCD nuclease subunit
MNLGIFTDIHFQPTGLDRIVRTGDWIIEEFQRQQVQAVICMGDALVTREEVDVVAQSAAINFFRKLADHWPVFLTLGNHDLNLKHSTSVSSLDGLDMHPKIKVFREITLVGNRFLFIPYHEDQSKIVQWVQDYARQSPEIAKNIIVFGHLSLNGAVQNTKYNTTFAGAIGPDLFQPFKATYSGHFHVHNKMNNRVTYVGSPLQFNFGDAGDTRGIMILDPDTGEDRFIANPHHDAFKVIAAKDITAELLPTLKDCFVTVIYDDIVTDDQHEAIQNRLEEAGVLGIKKESVVEKAIREHTVEVEGTQANSAGDLVEPFVKSVLTPDSQLDQATAITFGKAIITEVNAALGNVSDIGAVFEGDITDIFITRFLGVKDTIHIKVSDLAKGIWYLEGENGHGKSTVLEAIFWCYFDETIRSGMKADDVIYDPHETGRGKDCEVTVVHANGWSITRYRKHSKMGAVGVKVFKDGFYREDFEKGDPKATQDAIENLLGTNAQNFCRSYIMGQNITANFITGDEKKRRAMIEEMLGLERFDAYLAKTREYKKLISDQLEQQENIQKVRVTEIERSAGQISSIDGQIIAAEQQHQTNMDTLAQWQVDNKLLFAGQQAKMKQTIEELEESSKVYHDRWLAACDEHQAVMGGQATVEADAQVETDKAVLAEVKIGRIKLITSTRSGQEMNITSSEADQKNKIGIAQAKITAVQAAVDQEDKVVAAHRHADACRMNANIADQAAAENRATAAALEAQATPLVTKKGRIFSLTTSECPTCLQPVDKAGLDAIVAGLDTEIVALRTKWTEVNAAAKAKTEEATKLRADADATLNGMPTLAQIEAAKVLIQTLKTQVTGHEQQLANCQEMRKNADKAMADALALEGNVSIEDLTTQAAAHRAAATAILSRIDKAKRQQVEQVLQEAETAHNKVSAALTKLRESKAAVEAGNAATVAEKAAQLERLRTTDPAAALKTTRERLLADRTKALAEMEAAKTQAQALSQKSAYVTFWDRAFASKGSMRSFLLDQSVKALNTVVQGYISQHFGGRLTLTLNSDLTFQERYGRRSGGQRRWTDLAALFALFELSRQRSRYRASFLGLDEVFDALDIKGRQAVLDLIAGLAARVSRIFVITHVAVLGSSRAGTIQAYMPDVDTGTTLTVKPT